MSTRVVRSRTSKASTRGRGRAGQYNKTLSGHGSPGAARHHPHQYSSPGTTYPDAQEDQYDKSMKEPDGEVTTSVSRGQERTLER